MSRNIQSQLLSIQLDKSSYPLDYSQISDILIWSILINIRIEFKVCWKNIDQISKAIENQRSAELETLLKLLSFCRINSFNHRWMNKNRFFSSRTSFLQKQIIGMEIWSHCYVLSLFWWMFVWNSSIFYDLFIFFCYFFRFFHFIFSSKRT